MWKELLVRVINKAYKLRIYPNKDQALQIDRTIGSARYIYNHFLSERIKMYAESAKSSTYFTDCSKLVLLKKDPNHQWLNDTDKFALESSLRDLDAAYKNFFRGLKESHLNTGRPKFKSKKISTLSYRTTFTNNNIALQSGKIKLPKLKWIPFKDKRDLSNICKIFNATITKSRTNKYHVSVCVEEVIQKKHTNVSLIGIDLGLKSYLVTSNNEVVENPRWLRQSEKKLKQLQRSHAKKKKGSNNKEKARLKLALLHEKIRNQRRYFQQRLSTKYINDNQVIALETLKSSNMCKNHKLAKSIQDAGWYEFVRQIEYKGKWHGRDIVRIDPFYPSSQLCSTCKSKNIETKNLGCRVYICKNCGLNIDRDYNASINILNEGLSILSKSKTEGNYRG